MGFMKSLLTPRRQALASLAALASAAAVPGWAADARPVRLLTPFPAGAGPEAVLRLLAEKLQRRWARPVFVENRPGGNGFIAIDAFKRGATDGTDLIQLDNVHLVAYPHLFKKLPYDPVRDFKPLAPLFRTYFFVAVAANSPFRTVGDILAQARARPGELHYGSWSIGNPVHLGSALLEAMSGTQMSHVTYKETSMLYGGVASGELSFALGSIATAGPLQRAGKLKFIAITAPRRHPGFPDVPTVVESDGPQGFEASGWTLVAAPPGSPRAAVDKLYQDIEAALAEPDIRERYAAVGYETFPTTREQFAAFIAEESAKYADVIRRAKVSLD